MIVQVKGAYVSLMATTSSREVKMDDRLYSFAVFAGFFFPSMHPRKLGSYSYVPFRLLTEMRW